MSVALCWRHVSKSVKSEADMPLSVDVIAGIAEQLMSKADVLQKEKWVIE